MARYLFTVAYDGAFFSGWQIQKGVPTVQEELENALHVITGGQIRIHGSGRTDAGVHALGQRFHADIPEALKIPEENWPQAFNTRLPHSIRILHCREVGADFHARFDAVEKSYVYRLVSDRILMPWDYSRVGHYPHAIDGDLLAEAIAAFQGTHDFCSFAAVRGNEPDPVPEDFYIRTITEASVRRNPGGYVIRFTGNGFLYKMVRMMMGTGYAVANGKISLDELKSLLHSPNGNKTRFCAVPQGLVLESVRYEKKGV